MEVRDEYYSALRKTYMVGKKWQLDRYSYTNSDGIEDQPPQTSSKRQAASKARDL